MAAPSPSGRRRGSKRRGGVRRAIRWTHVWIGFVLSVALLVLAVTGTALVYKEAYWRLVHPELRGPAPVSTPASDAAAIAASERAFGERLRSVKLPEPGVPAYHLYLTDGEAFVSATDFTVIDEWRPNETLMSFLFDLHAHLMAGETGERVGGWIGLLAVLLSVTGLVLWWPTRKQFRWRHVVAPTGFSRRELVAWHRDIGVVSTPIVLILLLSAGALVFYETTGAVLNGLFGDPPVTMTTPDPAAGTPVALADEALLRRVEEEFPDARLVFYYPPRDGITYNEFRLKQPCELHPNGRSYLYLDAAGAVLQKEDACFIPPGQELLHAGYPLHSGKADSAVYKFLTFLGGLALAVLAASGAVGYGRKLLGGR